MADSSPTSAPDAGGGIGGRPMWVYLVGAGVAVGAYLLWRNHTANAAATAASGGLVSPTSTDGTGQVSFDPSTGLPIDPSTGLPYLTSQPTSPTDNSAWLTAAEAAAKNLGYAPALVQQSLYDFLNGNSLNGQESGVINKLLGQVGYPPVLIPFLGTPPAATSGGTTKTSGPTAAQIAANKLAHLPTLAAINKNRVAHGESPLSAAMAKAKGIAFKPAPATRLPAAKPLAVAAPRPHVPGVAQLATPHSPVPHAPIFLAGAAA